MMFRTVCRLPPLYALEKLHDVFNVAGTPADDRWTYYYKKAPTAQRSTQIDYIFVSEALKNAVSNVQVHRRGMNAVAEGDIQGVEPYQGITGWRDAASDHAAISVELEGLSVTG